MLIYGITDGAITKAVDNGSDEWTLGSGTIQIMRFANNTDAKIEKVHANAKAKVYNATILEIADNSLVACGVISGRLCVIVPSDCDDLSE